MLLTIVHEGIDEAQCKKHCSLRHVILVIEVMQKRVNTHDAVGMPPGIAQAGALVVVTQATRLISTSQSTEQVKIFNYCVKPSLCTDDVAKYADGATTNPGRVARLASRTVSNTSVMRSLLIGPKMFDARAEIAPATSRACPCSQRNAVAVACIVCLGMRSN